MNLRVIGAGFGRTGTESLREALRRKRLPPIVPKIDTEAEKEAA